VLRDEPSQQQTTNVERMWQTSWMIHNRYRHSVHIGKGWDVKYTRNRSHNQGRATLEGRRSSKGKVPRKTPFKSEKAFEGEMPTKRMPRKEVHTWHFEDAHASKKGFENKTSYRYKSGQVKQLKQWSQNILYNCNITIGPTPWLKSTRERASIKAHARKLHYVWKTWALIRFQRVDHHDIH
jgi:hypothetical protein